MNSWFYATHDDRCKGNLRYVCVWPEYYIYMHFQVLATEKAWMDVTK